MRVVGLKVNSIFYYYIIMKILKKIIGWLILSNVVPLLFGIFRDKDTSFKVAFLAGYFLEISGVIFIGLILLAISWIDDE